MKTQWTSLLLSTLFVGGCQTAVPFAPGPDEAAAPPAAKEGAPPQPPAGSESPPTENQAAPSPRGSDPGSPGPTWSARHKQGRAHLKRGELSQAEDAFAAAYDQTRGYRSGDPRTLATVRNLQRVSAAYLASGDSTSFGRTMELLVFVSGEVPDARNLELVRLLRELAATRMLQERPGDARDALLLAHSIQEEQGGPNDGALAGIQSQLGIAFIELGDLESAQQAIDRAAELAARESPPDAQVLVARGKLEVARDDPEAARLAVQSAVDANAERFGPQHPETARIVRELALLEQRLGDNRSAQEQFDRVISIWDSLPREKRQQALSRNDLAWFLVETGQDAQAEAPARSAVEMLEANRVEGQLLSSAADTLATSLRNQGKYEEAETFYVLALEEGSKASDLAGWDIGEIADRYAVLLEQTDRGDEAADIRLRWNASSPAPAPSEEP